MNNGRKNEIAVFDIGGTWFRRGLYTHDGRLSDVSKTPALNFKTTPHRDVRELQERLTDYLVQSVKAMGHGAHEVRAAAISMGAAINGHTGEILNSGPLWGPECQPFNMYLDLQQKSPDVTWLIINDVSAALLRYATESRLRQCRRINLITVSSGIACRTYDQTHDYIPLNNYGIQGEIGHLPVAFSLFGEAMHIACDCGGMDHLNAFSSGRGIENVLRHIPRTVVDQFSPALATVIRNAGPQLTQDFFHEFDQSDKLAVAVLDAITYPLAYAIIGMVTIDPEIEKIIVTGGVAHSSGGCYMDSLMRNLNKIGVYQIPDIESFLDNLIELGVDDDNSGLIGGAIAYENSYNKKV